MALTGQRVSAFQSSDNSICQNVLSNFSQPLILFWNCVRFQIVWGKEQQLKILLIMQLIIDKILGMFATFQFSLLSSGVVSQIVKIKIYAIIISCYVGDAPKAYLIETSQR